MNKPTFTDRLAALARTFPTLAEADGLDPFDVAKLLARADTQGSGARHAAAFIANIYNHANPFNLAAAMATWDAEHRAAFQAWANDPFIH